MEAPPAPADADAPAWHALEPQDVEASLRTTSRGLSAAEVAARLARYGPNEIEAQPPPSWLAVLARQFRSPLIYILVAAAGVTVLLGEYIDTGVIGAVLAINASIGFVQERKAEGAVRALMALVVPQARVVREGHEAIVDSRELVPGDIVLLEPGGRVPADLRLLTASSLAIDESLLTGESVTVRKRLVAIDRAVRLADRRNMAYTGTVVSSGRGSGVVVTTGARTALGGIAELLRTEPLTATPLQHRMTRFARVIGIAVGLASLVVFLSGMAIGGSASDMFLTAVALAVAAIPEGLPVVYTITLALGVRRMAKRNAIIRRLPAVETLGSTTVIGSDKTGTLTQNRMSVTTVWAGDRWFRLLDAGDDGGEFLYGDEPASIDEHPALHETLLAGTLSNEADLHHDDADPARGVVATGDPTEVALLRSAEALGIRPRAARDGHPLIAEIPFEPERRYSASVRVRHGHQQVFVKGAPERVVDMCTTALTDVGLRPIDRAAVLAAANEMAGRGLRVLAMASRELCEPVREPDDIAEPSGLVFAGLQGMIDPPRAGVHEAIEICHGAGVRVRMITGDHVGTASAIAAELGLSADGAQALNGDELARLTDEDLARRVDDVAVYARVSPEDKLRVVRALQDRGEVVAVTGDGVNDAPALKAAAIGVAMGRSGTDVAREASDMVLADDNFTSIAAAVEEGRVTFDNLRKATFFLVSTGAATILAIAVAVWLGWPLLMVPAQLLWLNLVTNGVQDVALAFEPGEKDVAKRAPRPRGEGLLSRLLWERTLVVGAVMAVGALVMFRWELDRTGSHTQAQTVALTTMVVFMAFHAGNSRSETRSVLQISPFSNPFLFVATSGALAIHVGALYLPPTQYVLRVEPLDASRWLVIVPVAATILVAVELHKLVRCGRGRSGGRRSHRRPR